MQCLFGDKERNILVHSIIKTVKWSGTKLSEWQGTRQELQALAAAVHHQVDHSSWPSRFGRPSVPGMSIQPHRSSPTHPVTQLATIGIHRARKEEENHGARGTEPKLVRKTICPATRGSIIASDSVFIELANEPGILANRSRILEGSSCCIGLATEGKWGRFEDASFRGFRVGGPPFERTLDRK